VTYTITAYINHALEPDRWDVGWLTPGITNFDSAYHHLQSFGNREDAECFRQAMESDADDFVRRY